ncbi:RHS repeat-associated core domain-containing protein [Streptomyces sp. NPDC052012]|uniref:RHS repeat-associated core domain-containing protein n=1 Tax=Streptomyces sp. NPDC052012 TaxID=3155051 RepID=UPI00344E8AEC
MTYFDQEGRLAKSADKQGRVVLYDRNAAGFVSSLTSPSGQKAELTYTDSKVASIALSDGRRVSYGYTDGRLSQVTHPDGNRVSYKYNAGGRITEVIDQRGNAAVTNVYDDMGRVKEQADALGNKTQFAYRGGETDVTSPNGGVWTDVYEQNVLLAQYDPFGNKTTYGYTYRLDPVEVTDALGNKVNREVDGAGRLEKIRTALSSRSWTYDASGNVSLFTNGNTKRSSYSYDAKSQLSTATNALGKKVTFTYTDRGQLETVTDPRGKLTTYGYDAVGNRTSQMFADGTRWTWGFDAAGRVASSTDPRGNAPGADPAGFTTNFTYDDAGRLTSTKDTNGNTARNEYDAAGNLISVTDAAGKVTRFAYDAANQLTEVKDAAGHVSKMTYDVMGNVASRTDASGAKTTYTYDKASRLLTMTPPRGNVTGADAAKYTWKYGYDKVGNQITVTDPAGNTTKTDYDAEYRPIAITDGLGMVRKTGYDREGNVTKTTDALGKSTSHTYDANNQLLTTVDRGGKTVTYSYDDAGNLSSEISPLGNKTTYAYDDNGRLTTTVEPRGNISGADPAQYTWSRAYDAAGNVLTQTDPYGKITFTNAYDGDGRLVERTDALGKKTAYEHDVLGRLIKVTAPDGGITNLSYDALGNLTSRKDANGHTTTYGYDGAGRLTKITDPLGRATSYAYDADGNRTTITNARGQKVTNTYDARNLLTAATFSDGSPTVNYTYDAAGQPKTIKDGTGTRTVTYDHEGRPLTITSPGATNPFTYTYNDNGSIKSRTYPDGRAITYAYDSDGHMLSQTAGGKTSNYTWDAAGNLTSVKLPTTTAVTEARTYDRAGRLASVSQGTGARHFERDAAGRVIKDYFKDATTTALADRYAYDAAGRMTRACTDTAATISCLSGNSGSTYAYDKVGNLTTSSTASSTRTNTYDAADQLTKRVEGTTTVDFTFDADGNRTKDAAGTYAYDPLGRVKSSTIGTDTYTFVNDADGNRTITNKNGALSRTSRWDVVNPLAQIATDTDSTGALIADYQYNPEGIAESQNRSSGTFFMRHDRQNSISAVYDAAGKENYTYSYSAWGVPTGKASITDGQTSIFGYTGQYKDPVLSGRLYLRERSYDPSNRRFTTPDPEHPANDSPNQSPYVYANNDPLNQSDPSGRCPMCISAGIGAVIGGAIEGGTYGWQHRNGGFSWGGFGKAVGKGAITGGIGGVLMPGAGNVAARSLGLTGGRALATSTAVNAAVGAGYAYTVNTAFCRPTTAGDLLLGAVGGGSSSLVGPAFSWLKGKSFRASPQKYGPGAAHADDPAFRGGGTFSLASIPEEPGFNYLYRGVSVESPAFDNATRGIAIPRGGSASMRAHHDGNTDSPYTSWTTSKQTALQYARGAAEGRSDLPGVILQAKLPLGQPVYPSFMISDELWEGNENLVEGIVQGAKVYFVPAP